MDRVSILDLLGMTKTKIDDGDGSEYQVPDNDRLKALAEMAQSMSVQMPSAQSGVLRPQQVSSSPAPVMGATPNPYAPVNYGTMQYGQSGIGGAPTMEQILKALQSRGM